MPKLQLGFHGTFALKKDDLRKILEVAAEEEGLNHKQEELMKRTGLGNKKISPIKSWAIRSGFITDKHLSPEGKIIRQQDYYLQSPITDWFMHFYLSFGGYGLQPPPATPTEWGGWPYLVFDFLPKQTIFTLEQLVDSASMVFEESPKQIKKNFRYLLRAYTESHALLQCHFLTQEKETYIASQAPLPHPYLIGYFLAKLWERDFGETTSVLTEQIFKQPMGLGAILGIEDDLLQGCLNQLETLALIEQRRTVPPEQVVRQWSSPLDLLEKAYAAF
ncbi:MAG: DUF4007 family protein [Kamptonema sp. SIO4C4]|nr:DUF4007 family protein [Kamptonema sp. SIO4C4]